MYFGSRETRELLRALYRDLYRYPLIERIRRANGNTTDLDVINREFQAQLAASRFLGVGNPSESGTHLLYYFRQENSLPKPLFIHTHQIFRRYADPADLQLRDPSVNRYVFIDDLCGSGQQASEYSADLVADIKRLRPDAFVAYYVLFATSKGINEVRTTTGFDDAQCVFDLDDSFRCFGPRSRYFDPSINDIDKSFSEGMCRHYGEELLPGHALGYRDSQLLLGFHHNTPDNTLPVFWYDETEGHPWRPIFRRYPKIYGVVIT
jgi:hypothetical protein